MKKLIFLLGIIFFAIPEVDAINLSYETGFSSYYVNINGKINRLKKIKNTDTNEYLFNMKFDNYENNENFIKSNKFNNEISKEYFNNINNAIYFGYIEKEKKDIFYYITQVLIYKYYYGFDNAYMCSSSGGRIIVYDEIMNNIHNNYNLKNISNINHKLFEDINLDNKYRYNLNNYNNKKVGTYQIDYYLDEKYEYYYSDNNILFNENNNVLSSGTFEINVNGINFDFIGDSNTFYELYEDDRLITKFKGDNPIKYLNKNSSYLIKYDNDLVHEFITTDNDINITLKTPEKKEIINNFKTIDKKIVINDIKTPKTKDNIINYFVIMVIILFISLFSSIKYQKN